MKGYGSKFVQNLAGNTTSTNIPKNAHILVLIELKNKDDPRAMECQVVVVLSVLDVMFYCEIQLRHFIILLITLYYLKFVEILPINYLAWGELKKQKRIKTDDYHVCLTSCNAPRILAQILIFTI
mgnify:CR=1 FL=1